MRKFWISLFDNLFLTEARPQQLTFEQLSNLLVQPGEAYRVWDKRKLPQWRPATFQPPRRKKAHAHGASFGHSCRTLPIRMPMPPRFIAQVEYALPSHNGVPGPVGCVEGSTCGEGCSCSEEGDGARCSGGALGL